VSRWLHKIAATLPWLEPLALAVAAPFLLFPTTRPRWTAIMLALLAAFYLLRWIVRREPWPSTPFNGALLLLAVVIPVAVWASALPDLTLPKLTGLILGLGAYRAIAFSVHDRRGFLWGVAALALVGLAIWAVGFLGAGWGTKFAWFGPILGRLPHAFTVLPSAPDSGINPNQLAGALVFFLPLAVAGVVAGWRERRWPALLALAALGLAFGTLALTQSRSGWLGAMAGLLVLGILAGLASRQRRLQVLAVALPLALILAFSAFFATRPDIIARFFDTPGGATGEVSFSGRPEIWSRAIYAIQDFPFTGTGLGTFRRVMNLLYPLFTISPDTDIAHAHNMFLQVAVDVGLPGLIAYLALLELAGVVAWGAARRSSGAVRNLGLGLFAGLIALHVYGLADAIALGSKPGLVFWMALGLIAVLPRVTGGAAGPMKLTEIPGHPTDATPPCLS
jgi:putative inorganic carbon (HCO3(-)) transporter